MSEETKKTTKDKYKHVGFDHSGVKIILPEKMGYAEAIRHLTLKQQEEETQISIHEEVNAFPLDGAYMLMRVLQQRYGWASPAPTPGFFGDTPPTMANLEVGFEENAQVIWGNFRIPGIEGTISTGATRSKGRWIFVIKGTVKKKHETEVKTIAEEVRRRIKNESVYKGKAIRMTTDEDGCLEPSTPPTFLDLKRVNEAELVLPTDVEQQVATSLYTPIEKTEQCRAHNVPLKRGILLEGPYGTGKTLTAYVTAKKCVDNGWSFIYIDKVSALKEAIIFARQYMPAVIFAEDIDRAVEGEERTTDIDDVLNTIDGIDSKNSEIMVVLTTNHVEKINRAMLRPGRLDAVISIQPPDREAAQKLVRVYGRGLVDQYEKLTATGQELAGQIPAVIREVVERAKMNAIYRIKGSEPFTLKDVDLAAAARGMKNHLELMNPKSKILRSPEEKLGRAFKVVAETAFNGGLQKALKANGQAEDFA